MALVVTSVMPLVLLDKQLVVEAISESFCSSFAIACADAVGKSMFELGSGEWNSPQFRLLLEATAAGKADIAAYEFTLHRPGQPDRFLILHAHVLDHGGELAPQLALAVSDITAIRESDCALLAATKRNETLLQEKHVLLQELNHRVANSLQIIASIMMQRVRSVQSEETRTHLRDAHNRLMSIAKLQRLLASSNTGDVPLRTYLTDLCASVAASMIADPAKLTLSVTVDETVMSPDRSVSLGLIVTELAINALKHAFPAPDHVGRIMVTFAAHENGWELKVADNGVGMPEGHETAKPGLGTGIVNALAGQLSASVVISSSNPGTTVTVAHLSA